jgi:hypothetical protein
MERANWFIEKCFRLCLEQLFQFSCFFPFYPKRGNKQRDCQDYEYGSEDGDGNMEYRLPMENSV